MLATLLSNGIKNKRKASSVVALDFGRGAAVAKLQDGGMTSASRRPERDGATRDAQHIRDADLNAIVLCPCIQHGWKLIE